MYTFSVFSIAIGFIVAVVGFAAATTIYKSKLMKSLAGIAAALGVVLFLLGFCSIGAELKKNRQKKTWIHILELEVKMEKAQERVALKKKSLSKEEGILKRIQEILERGDFEDGIKIGDKAYTKKEVRIDVLTRLRKCKKLRERINRYQQKINELDSSKEKTGRVYSNNYHLYGARGRFEWEQPEWIASWKQEHQELGTELEFELEGPFELESPIDWTGADVIVDWPMSENISPLEILQEYFSEAEKMMIPARVRECSEVSGDIR